MDIDAYLKRIHYTDELDTTLATLRKLHYQHQLTIPIENLSIHYGQEIILDPDALFDKIITRKRGGFCYELNGLFFEFLQAIGFQVKRVSGRVHDDVNGFHPEFDHLSIIAHVDGIDWLLDVGFGRQFPVYPLLLTLNQIQEDRTGRYKITELDADNLVIKQQNEQGDWIPGYSFTCIPRELADFTEMCHFHQTSKESFFSRNKLCTIVTPHGRITLTDHTLKITDNGQVVDHVIADQQEFEDFLLDCFAIKMTQPALHKLPN
jgi:N-hydroxyarylamine O-acetyltransferase